MSSFLRRAPRSRRRVGAVAIAAALLIVPTAMAVTGAGTAAAASGCRVTYTVTNQWSTGFGAGVAVTNLGDPLSSWTLTWSFAAGQHVDSGWNGVFAQTGSAVTVTNAPYNGALGAGATVTPGFNGSWTGSNPVPAAFALNGVACTGAVTPTPPVSSPPVPPVSSPPVSTPPVPPVSTPPAPPGTRVDNPFTGATAYLNPDYTAVVAQEATAAGGTLATRMRAVANNPTAVWLDRIAAVTGGAANGGRRGLAGHLDAALAQRRGTTPITATFVIYDLPERDCAAAASNGELSIAANGLARYKTEYIDPIAQILADPKYRDIRIVTVIEPDSLPNLVTNLNIQKCALANSSGAYVQGVQYALNKLSSLGNVYSYIDIAHSGWLGWDTNLNPAVQLMTSVVRGATPSGRLDIISGFISNTANYTPSVEPNLTDSNLSINNQPLRSAHFYEWNPNFDEVDFTSALYTAFVAAGFPANLGMLIDTSRNGWGGAGRPTGASGTTVDAYVDSGRIDRRIHRGSWCNQTGAGIGARPTASPIAGTHLDAYVWIKPPGESDGTSDASQTTPDPEGKRYDPNCDPTKIGTLTGAPTGALPNSPSAGSWFPAEFRMLVENAFPAL
jgi:cellulose 1,4-beta-cellobiosidase